MVVAMPMSVSEQNVEGTTGRARGLPPGSALATAEHAAHLLCHLRPNGCWPRRGGRGPRGSETPRALPPRRLKVTWQCSLCVASSELLNLAPSWFLPLCECR